MTDVRIWVDDERTPPVGWLWAKTPGAAIAALRAPDVTDISFDHDLGKDDNGHEYRVLDVVDWMRMTETWPQRVDIHSWNGVGSENIMRALIHDGPYQQRTPRTVVRTT